MANVNYVSPTAPATGWKPKGALAGMLFADDRAMYEDQMSMQQYMSGLDARKQTATLEDYFAERPSKVGSNIATNNAIAQTIGREKLAGVEQTELGNEFSRLTLGNRVADSGLSLRIKERDEQRKSVQRGIEVAGVLRAAAMSGTPGAMAQVVQMLPNDPDSQKVVEFIKGATSQQDLLGRINQIMDVYKSLDMGYQKELLDLQAAKLKADKENKPDWDQKYIEELTRAYTEEGMSPREARVKATREVLAARAGLAGARAVPPEQAGQTTAAQETARRVAELKGMAGMLPENSPMRARLLKMATEMEGGQKPTAVKPPAQRVIPIEKAREFLKNNNTPENRKFFEETYGEKP